MLRAEHESRGCALTQKPPSRIPRGAARGHFRGALLRGGTIIDATLIAASPSTKNKDRSATPEMRSSKKGNQWYVGMKAHNIGVDATSGFVHTAGVTKGSVHDAKVII